MLDESPFIGDYATARWITRELCNTMKIDRSKSMESMNTNLQLIDSNRNIRICVRRMWNKVGRRRYRYVVHFAIRGDISFHLFFSFGLNTQSIKQATQILRKTLQIRAKRQKAVGILQDL